MAGTGGRANRSPYVRRLACAGALLAAFSAAPAAAQVSGLQMSGPPPFGILLGDVFTLRTRLDVAQPFRLERAALPKPGAVTYWLDLRSIEVQESPGPGGSTRYDVAAEYQTFYSALETIEQTVPPLTLVVVDGAGKRVERQSASWKFLTSPLRPVATVAGGDGEAYALRPDAAPLWRSLRPAETNVAAAGVGFVTALALLAWSRAWPPFHRRKSRPFAAAARTISRQARSGEAGWRTALLVLHRAFDAAAGKRLLGDDLAAFLAARPGFRRHEAAIRSFFSASRRAFFGGRSGMADLPPEALARLARDLAAAERAS
jgi:mxaA protein